MGVSASDVKLLRDKTSAGMMDCKKALVEAKGDFTKAEKILKELGLAAADKRSGRVTKEGRIFSKVTDKKGILLELSCETDFVSKNLSFIKLGNNLIQKILENNISDMKNEELDGMLKDTIGIIKENMSLKRFTTMDIADNNELAIDYIHGEGRIGVIVKLKVDNPALKHNQMVKEKCFDLALHIAAYAPLFLSKENVPEDYIKEQEEIFLKQAKNLGKPEKVLNGIVKGKLNKHFSEICVMEQGFVKEDKKKVSQVLKELSQEVGGQVEISDYLYFKVGVE